MSSGSNTVPDQQDYVQVGLCRQDVSAGDDLLPARRDVLVWWSVSGRRRGREELAYAHFMSSAVAASCPRRHRRHSPQRFGHQTAVRS